MAPLRLLGSLLLGLLLLLADDGSSIPSPLSGLDGPLPLFLPPAWWEDEAVRLGAEEVARSLAESYGSQVTLQRSDPLTAPPARAVLVGGTDALWLGRRLEPLAAEGYELRLERLGAELRFQVVAQDPLGAAYGLFRLAERVRLAASAKNAEREILGARGRLRAEPAMAFRLLADPLTDEVPMPAEALRLGFNAIAIAPWPALALYDEVAPWIYDAQRYSGERAWVEAQRRRAAARLDEAKRLHLQVVSPGDLPSLPYQALPSLDGQPRACLESPETRSLVRAALEEVLTAFPEIDALLVRVGENYPLGPLVGTALRECGSDYRASLVEALELVASAAEAHGATALFRAWDLGAEGFHASPAIARAVTASPEPLPHLWLSFKHTQTDFWRYNPVNPNLGATGYPEVVEFQAAREYEGKGAFPNYLGELFARGGGEREPAGGMAYAHRRGVRGVWVWGQGGGWGGPYPASQLWNEANVYALARLAWDPAAAPEVLAWEWATLRFGPAAAPPLTRLLLRSPQATLLGFYIGPVAAQVGPWAPHLLWVRDDRIFGSEHLRALYSFSRSLAAFQRALGEKQRALRLVQAMEEDLAAALPHIADPALREELRASLLYERSLLATLSHYLAGMFYTERWLRGGREERLAWRLAQEHLRAWERAWVDHRALLVAPRAATPYQDVGMEAAVAWAWEKLKG